MIFKTFWRKNKPKADRTADITAISNDFKFKTTVEIRFADLDMMGHVNNAIYFTYMEVSRAKYWDKAVHWDWIKTGVVIGKANIDYIKPILLDDKIHIYVRTSRIGNSSFDLEYLIVKEQLGKEILCSKGMTSCIAIDYATKRSTVIPATERNKMIAFEQLTP